MVGGRERERERKEHEMRLEVKPGAMIVTIMNYHAKIIDNIYGVLILCQALT